MIVYEKIKKVFLNKKLNWLKKLPKKLSGSFFFNEYLIEYLDSRSCFHECKDIFENKIYHFKTTKKKPFIIDAGGYIGLASLYFKKIYPDAEIVVFEPDPNIFKFLKKNIENNKIENVSLENVGLGKLKSNSLLYPDGSDGGTLYFVDGVEPVEMKIVKLSKYIDRPVDLLKMNIEGMESDVFEEIEGKLKFINEIIFEYHSFSNLPQTLGKILTLLDRNGFKYVVSEATNAKIALPFNLPEEYRYFNLVYAKKKSC